MKKIFGILSLLILLTTGNLTFAQKSKSPSKDINLLAGSVKGENLPKGWSSGGCTKAAFQSASIYFELNSAEDVCRLFFTADLPGGKYTLNAAYSVDGNNVIITITDSSGAIRTTSTTTFGYYRFDDVQAGETYIISARGKRFTFTQPSQILNANEDINDINFIGYVSSFLR